jgi:hypothetical protein
MPSFDQTPDKPEPFGFKISWFAVKATDPGRARVQGGNAGQLGFRPCSCVLECPEPRMLGLCVPTGQRLGLGCKLFLAVPHQ